MTQPQPVLVGTGRIHLGQPSRFPGMVVLACSGRTMSGTVGNAKAGSRFAQVCAKCFDVREGS